MFHKQRSAKLILCQSSFSRTSFKVNYQRQASSIHCLWPPAGFVVQISLGKSRSTEDHLHGVTVQGAEHVRANQLRTSVPS